MGLELSEGIPHDPGWGLVGQEQGTQGQGAGAVMHDALAMVVLGLAVVLQCLQARCIHSSYDFSPEVSFQLLSLKGSETSLTPRGTGN